MKKYFFVVLLLISLLVIGCKKSAKKEITCVLDWTPNTDHTGLYVAQAKGFFEAQGLSVQIVQPPEDGSALMTASGKAQFGIACQDTLAPALIGDNPLPVIAVAAILQHNTSGIISLKENGIDRPAALCGRNYATWDNPVEKAIIKAVVEKDGGDFSDINLIPSTVYDTITALNSGIDSVWVMYAWDGIGTKIKGIETNFIDFGKIDPVFDYYTPFFIANIDFLKSDGESAKKFLLAVKEGFEYAIENPEESAEILCNAAPELDRELVFESQKWIASQYKAEEKRWGYFSPERWNRFYRWLSESGLVSSPIPDDTGYTNDYLSD